MKNLYLVIILWVLDVETGRADDYDNIKNMYKDGMFIGYNRLQDLYESFQYQSHSLSAFATLRKGATNLSNFLSSAAIKEHLNQSALFLFIDISTKPARAKYKMMNDVSLDITDLKWQDDVIREVALLLHKYSTNTAQLERSILDKSRNVLSVIELVERWQNESLVSLRMLVSLTSYVAKSLEYSYKFATAISEDLLIQGAFAELKKNQATAQSLATQMTWSSMDKGKIEQLLLSMRNLISLWNRPIELAKAGWCSSDLKSGIGDSDYKVHIIRNGLGQKSLLCADREASCVPLVEISKNVHLKIRNLSGALWIHEYLDDRKISSRMFDLNDCFVTFDGRHGLLQFVLSKR